MKIFISGIFTMKSDELQQKRLGYKLIYRI